jgi:tRNA nucleotidyltransferase/poly(A) polymerase
MTITHGTGPEEVKASLKRANPRLFEMTQKIASAVAECPKLEGVSQSPSLLIYGGFVRDAVWGHTASEADIQVFGVAPQRIEEILHAIFPDQVRRAGKQYQVLKVELDRDHVLDVSVPRRETYGYSPHELGDPSLTPEEAARYRDFTINSLAADPLTGSLVDPISALKDIRSKTLRAIDPSTFRLRPIHVFRGCQLAARFQLDADRSTLELMRSMAEEGLTFKTPGNAIAEELKKTLLKPHTPSKGIALMHEVGIIHAHFPGLAPRASHDPSWREWCAAVDRAVPTAKRARLMVHERTAVALAVFFSRAVAALSDDNEKIERLREMIAPLSLTPQFTAFIIQCVLHASHVSSIPLSSPKRAFRLRPPGRRGRIPSRSSEPSDDDHRHAGERTVEFLSQLVPASWPAVLTTAYVLQPSIDASGYATHFEQISKEYTIRQSVSILTAKEVSEITGIEDRERVETILHDVRLKRHVLITKERAAAYVRYHHEELDLTLEETAFEAA